MLASAGQPSLHGYHACMVYWTKGALRRNCRLKQRETSFSPYWVFLFSRNSRERFLGFNSLAFLGWEGKASWATLPCHVSLEFHNVGGWPTHGDLALEAGVDFSCCC